MGRPEDRLTAILSTINEGVVIHDANGRVETCNESAGRILGMAGGQMCGLDSLDPRGRAIHEDGTPFPHETHPAMVTLRTGQPLAGIIMGIYRPDGALRWISINSRAIFRDGKPESAISTITDVTDQRAAHETERLYRELFDGAVEGMYRTSPEGRTLVANPAVARILGYSSDEAVVIAISDTSRQVWLDPNERLKCVQILENQGVVHGYECQFKRKDGTPVWVSLDVRKVCGADGKTLFYEGFLRDIDERRRVVNALQESERKFATLFRFSPAATSLSDMSAGFRLADVNEAFEQTMGYERGDVIGRTSAELELWPYPEEFAAGESQLRRHGRVRNFEFHFRRKDGIVRNGLISVETIELGGAAFVLAATIDVTELRRSEEALRETSQQLFKIASCVPDTIWTIDLSGRFTYLSSNVQRTHGWTVEEALNRNLRDLVTPEQAIKNEVRLAEELNRASSLQYDRNSVATFESEELRKDGTVFWAEINASLLWSDDGRPIGVIGITRDISERKRAESELQQHREHLEHLVQQRTEELMIARDQAVAASQAKSAFLANMSHELRTPLNAILGFSSIIEESESVPAEHRNTARILHRSGEHLLGLINELLDMAKIEAGTVALENVPVDLHNLVVEVLDLMKVRTNEKLLELCLEKSPEVPPFVRTDPAKLRQILINLVANAVKFTKRGGVTVYLHAERSPRLSLQMEVADTGVGIPIEDQERIFAPFVQLGNSPMGGTGLGLSITSQYVRLMGGAITVESAPGSGSRFRILLPVEMAESGPEPAAWAETERVSGLAAGQSAWRVLVVDDQEDNRVLLQRLLADIGFEVRVAVNGAEALEAFRTWRPHFIWMDWRMPDMDGGQATACIRGMEGGREVKIAAVTASAIPEQWTAILASGVDDMVNKPFRREEIFECMARLLGVQYVYGKTPPLSSRTTPLELISDALRVLPVALRQELADAVISLDIEHIKEVVRRLSELDADLGATLEGLVSRLALSPIRRALRTLGEEPLEHSSPQ